MFEFILVMEIPNYIVLPQQNTNVKRTFNNNIEFKRKNYASMKMMFILIIFLMKYQLMDEFVPWWSACEIYPTLIQLFIEALCEPRRAVVDTTIYTYEFVILKSIFIFQYIILQYFNVSMYM